MTDNKTYEPTEADRALWREIMKTMIRVREPQPHGTHASYAEGCRCVACVSAKDAESDPP